MPVPTHHADALKSRFAGYYPRDGAVWLGVNLEGMKYDRLAGCATHRARDLRSAPPDQVSPESRKTRQSHRALGARRVAVLRPTPGSRRRISPRRRSRWIASMVRAGPMPCEARGNVWTPGGNIAAAGRFRSRCSLRNGTLGNDGLRWM